MTNIIKQTNDQVVRSGLEVAKIVVGLRHFNAGESP